jgi:hypothetical protein
MIDELPKGFINLCIWVIGLAVTMTIALTFITGIISIGAQTIQHILGC